MLYVFQRGFAVQFGGDQHERDSEPHGGSGLAEPRHLPQLMRHRRRVLPVRHSELHDEVGLVDLRRIPGLWPKFKLQRTKCCEPHSF